MSKEQSLKWVKDIETLTEYNRHYILGLELGLSLNRTSDNYRANIERSLKGACPGEDIQAFKDGFRDSEALGLPDTPIWLMPLIGVPRYWIPMEGFLK